MKKACNLGENKNHSYYCTCYQCRLERIRTASKKEAKKSREPQCRYRPVYNTESGVIGISFNNDKRYLKLDDGNIIDTETNTILIRNALQEILDY